MAERYGQINLLINGAFQRQLQNVSVNRNFQRNRVEAVGAFGYSDGNAFIEISGTMTIPPGGAEYVPKKDEEVDIQAELGSGAETISGRGVVMSVSYSSGVGEATTQDVTFEIEDEDPN